MHIHQKFISILLLFLFSLLSGCLDRPVSITLRKEVDYKSYYINDIPENFAVKKVAILPFINLTGHKETAKTARNFLYSKFKKTGKYDLLDNEIVDGVIENLKIAMESAAIFSNAVKIGKKLRVDAVIAGSTGDGVEWLTIRMIKIENKKIVWSFIYSPSDFVVTQKTEKGLEKIVIFDELTEKWKKYDNHKYGISLDNIRITAQFSGIPVSFPAITDYDIKEYRLFKSKNDPDDRYKEIAILYENYGENTVTYRDSDVQPDIVYYYKYRAVTQDNFQTGFSMYTAASVNTKPEPPLGLKAAENFVRQIKLEWKPARDDDVAGYRIYRSMERDGTFILIETIKNRETVQHIDGEKKDKSLPDKTTFYYKIAAYYNSQYESEPSAMAHAATPDPPSPPDVFTAERGGAKKIRLRWKADENKYTKGFRIYRSYSSDSKGRLLAEIKDRTINSFIDENSFLKSEKFLLSDGTIYYYRISSFNPIDIESELSEPVSISTKPVPAEVSGVTVVDNGAVKQISLQWDDSKEKDIMTYIILRSGKKEGRFKKTDSIPADRNRYTDKGLLDGVRFYYRIQALDKDGLHSKSSLIVEGNTKPKPSPPRGNGIHIIRK